MTWWREIQARMTTLLGADLDVVRKVDDMDQHQRKLGHDLRNIQMRIEPLRRLVEGVRGEEQRRSNHHG